MNQTKQRSIGRIKYFCHYQHSLPTRYTNYRIEVFVMVRFLIILLSIGLIFLIQLPVLVVMQQSSGMTDTPPSDGNKSKILNFSSTYR
jgi:hypothetical protein